MNYETLELTRLVRRDNARFANSDATSVKASELPAFEAYQKNKAEFEQELAEAKIGLERFEGIKNAIDEVVKKIGKENPTIQDFQSFKPSNDMEANIQRILLAQLKESSFEDFYKNQIM